MNKFNEMCCGQKMKLCLTESKGNLILKYFKCEVCGNKITAFDEKNKSRKRSTRNKNSFPRQMRAERSIIACYSCIKKKSKICNNTKVTKKTIADLEATLKSASEGIGLAAIQIGIPLRIAIVRIKDVKIDLINPEIIDKQEPFRNTKEMCLSIPGLSIDTRRYKRIKILNNGKEEEYSGFVAVAIQHEIDHTKGLTIKDRKWRNKST